MQLNTVVLPAPLGPMSAVMSLRAGDERQITDGGETTETHGEVFDA